jgi:two-component system, NarL family, nitrate/nitrite response regulator NarL
MPVKVIEMPADSLYLENLLRQLLNQIKMGEPTNYSPEERKDEAIILVEVQMDGRHYTLARCNLPEVSSNVTLSPREQEVVRLVTKGLSNKAIATTLDISVWTVSTHLRRVYTKLGVNSRAEMVTKTLQDRLLNVDLP